MRTVALVGFAENCNQAAYHLPDETELWSVNHAFTYQFPKLDRVIDIHNIKHINNPKYHNTGLRQDYHKYIDWLKQPHPFNIYMHDEYPQYPASKRYPIEEVIQLAGGKQHLTSSLPFMVALAMLEGNINRLEWYGFNMEHEWRYQRPDAYYWKGRAEGAGIEVYIPPESNLTYKTKLYGYEGSSMISRQTAEGHKSFYQKQYEYNEANLRVSQGVLQERSKTGDQDAINKAVSMVQKYSDQMKMSYAVTVAIQKLIDTCDIDEVEPGLKLEEF